MTDHNERPWISPEGIKNDPKFDKANIPKYRSWDEYVMDFAQTSVIAIMAAMIQAAEPERTYTECVGMSRGLYRETTRQIQESRK